MTEKANAVDMPPYPKGERIRVGYYNSDHELLFILTSKKDSDEWFYLYEYKDGSFNRLGRAKSPPQLEEKFGVVEKMNRKRKSEP